MKTVRVRIAVAVDPKGDWAASGWLKSTGEAADKEAMGICLDGVDEGEARYWIEATLPLPNETQTIEADSIRLSAA